mmetsp:Transcript_14255/g.30442  ORF Transcript_14255/g.30442 Transcript_14255/m.30442 type:complete len:246 (+) Transcript_14255:173-910(+)
MTGSSYQLNDDDIQYLSLLLGIIDAQNWEAFGYAILNHPTEFQSFARKICQSTELNGMTILHACVRLNPPPHIIKVLLQLVPESPSCIDCLQRTPLHIAAGTRASSPIIKLLVDAYPTACEIRDIDGKTPLHLACDSACELFEGDRESDAREPPRYDVVRTLAKASPLSVPLEDQDGMSALEHAIFSDAPIVVIKLLQYATRKQCEMQQKEQQASAIHANIVLARRGVFSRRKGDILENGNLFHA